MQNAHSNLKYIMHSKGNLTRELSFNWYINARTPSQPQFYSNPFCHYQLQINMPQGGFYSEDACATVIADMGSVHTAINTLSRSGSPSMSLEALEELLGGEIPSILDEEENAE